ncbi:hypothetical protein [Frigidibacter sp. SD6-1]|uniref:MoaF-related domain-containing protein n=1 Tax=Frigidibacter sp. SD6-1 TaxID=3032581 RepID=UPI0024DFE393|nr:hypothetical protein [Frigidibacter sp. SD6-1]
MRLQSMIATAAALMAFALPTLAETPYPAIGHTYKSDYGDMVFRTAFDADGKTMRTAPFDAENFEDTPPVAYKATYIRPGVFLVTWQEADGITVTHVEDFENDTVHSALTLPDTQFFTFTGKWTRLD